MTHQHVGIVCDTVECTPRAPHFINATRLNRAEQGATFACNVRPSASWLNAWRISRQVGLGHSLPCREITASPCAPHMLVRCAFLVRARHVWRWWQRGTSIEYGTTALFLSSQESQEIQEGQRAVPKDRRFTIVLPLTWCYLPWWSPRLYWTSPPRRRRWW